MHKKYRTDVTGKTLKLLCLVRLFNGVTRSVQVSLFTWISEFVSLLKLLMLSYGFKRSTVVNVYLCWMCIPENLKLIRKVLIIFTCFTFNTYRSICVAVFSTLANLSTLVYGALHTFLTLYLIILINKNCVMCMQCVQFVFVGAKWHTKKWTRQIRDKVLM